MKLKVTVAGQVKTGKSTVAYLIKQALNNVGIETTVVNPDVNEELLEGTAMRRVGALTKKGLTVEVEMLQTRREFPT